MPLTPHGVNFESNRPVVMGRNGMVAAGHPLAAQAGMAALQRGGNAVDAAIATAAALNVVEPNMSGIGGDGFIMIYNRQAGTIEVCNGTGAAPYAADPDLYRKNGIPNKGILSVSVPGLVDAWMAAHAKYGTLSRAEVFDAAIDLSENGFPVTHVLSRVIAGDRLLCEFPDSQAVFAPGSVPMQPGQILRQPGLARTFQTIVDGGRDAFYEGETARAIVRFSEEQGGLFTLKDLADCRSRWEAAISTTYHGHSVYEAPPNSSGHVLLQELNIIEQFDLKALGCNTPESIHLMVEAKKLAFADREAYMADPDWVDVPISGMLSKQYAAERARLIDPERGGGFGGPRRPVELPASELRSTTKGCGDGGADAGGGHHLFRGRGPLGQRRLPAPEHPEFARLQHRGGRDRHTAEQPDDLLASRSLTTSTACSRASGCATPLNPVMVFRDAGESRRSFQNGGSRDGGSGHGSLALVCGTPGADTQVQTNMQVITHVLDFGMTVAEAVEAPRWRNTHSPTESNIPHECDNLLYAESRFPAETLDGLRRRGHTLEVMHGWGASGSEMMIQVDEDSGALHGAADPRRDGYAIGW